MTEKLPTDCLYSPHSWNVENGQSSIGSTRTWILDNLTNVTVADWHWNWLWGLRLREYYWTKEIIKGYWFVDCFITAQTTLLHLDQDFWREREGPLCKKNLKAVGDWLKAVCVTSLGHRTKTRLKGNKNQPVSRIWNPSLGRFIYVFLYIEAEMPSNHLSLSGSGTTLSNSIDAVVYLPGAENKTL